MSLTDNIQDLSLLSSKPTDKIVKVWEGSVNIASLPVLGFYIPYFTIKHGFTRPLFVESQFSRDGVTWTDANNASPYTSGSALGIAYSTASDIYVLFGDYSGTLTGTFYYRIIGFWIDNYDNTNPLVPPTQGTDSDIYFDSRLNYQKIHLNSTTALSPSNDFISIPHGLGYEPNCRVYFESLGGQVWPAIFGGTKNWWFYDFDMSELRVQITTSALNLTLGGNVSAPSRKVWYTVYYDG